MIACCDKAQRKLASKIISVFIASIFLLTSVAPGYAQSLSAQLPTPSTMLAPTGNFNPVLLRAIEIDPKNPLHFGFIVDNGDTSLKGDALTGEAKKLIRYFLASLTTPEKDTWVNLSPYEKDRIIEENFGQTQMGRDLLAQDYILKQLTASLIYPEDELGKKFWDKVYKTAYEKYGTTNIPVDTFNKIWILPKKATVYENNNKVFVVDSELAVMMEEDYLALQKNVKPQAQNTSSLTSQIVRDVVLPAIEKEVNFGKNFANLRQVYSAMILATWYKNNLKESLLGQVYMDQNKIKGIDLVNKAEKQKIYDEYVNAFKKGIYDFIKVEHDQYTGKNIPRKYFSGGFIPRTPEGVELHDAVIEVVPSADKLQEKGTVTKFDANLTEDRSAGEAVSSAVVSRVPSSESAAVLLKEITGKFEKVGKMLTSFSIVTTDGNSHGFSLSDPRAQARLLSVIPHAKQVTMFFQDRSFLTFQKDAANYRWKITRFDGANFDFTDQGAKWDELGGSIKIPQIRTNMDLADIKTQIVAENIGLGLTSNDIKQVEFYRPDKKSLTAELLPGMPKDTKEPLTLKIFIRDGYIILHREKKADHWQLVSQGMPLGGAAVSASVVKGVWSFNRTPEYIGVVELRNDTERKVNLDDLLSKKKYQYLFENGLLRRSGDGHLILDNVVIVYTGIDIDGKGTDLLASSTKPVSSAILVPAATGRETARVLFENFQMDPMRLSAKFSDGTIRPFIASVNLKHYEEFTDYGAWKIDRALPVTFYHGWSAVEVPQEIYAWDANGNGLFLSLDVENNVYVPYRAYGEKYQDEAGVVDQGLMTVDQVNGLLEGLVPSDLKASEAKNKIVEILDEIAFVRDGDVLGDGEFTLEAKDGAAYHFVKDQENFQWVLSNIQKSASSGIDIAWPADAMNIYDVVMAIQKQIPHAIWSVEFNDQSYLERETGFASFFKAKNLKDGERLIVKLWEKDFNSPLKQVTIDQYGSYAVVQASRFSWNEKKQKFDINEDQGTTQVAVRAIDQMMPQPVASSALSKVRFIETLNRVLQRAADAGYQYSVKATQSPVWPRYEFGSYSQFLDAFDKKLPDGKNVLDYISAVDVVFTKGSETQNATIHFSRTGANVYYRVNAPLVGKFGQLFADFHDWRTINRPSLAMSKAVVSSAITLEDLDLENFSSRVRADSLAKRIAQAVDEPVKSEQISGNGDYLYILFEDGRYVAAFKHGQYWQSDVEQQHVIQDVETLMTGEQEKLSAAVSRSDTDAITKIVNEINALKIDGELMTADNLEAAPVDDLSRKNIDPREAAEMYLEGRFVPHFNYGGAATRLGLGSMYDVKITEVAKFLIGEPSTLTEKQKIKVTGELDKLFSTPEKLQEYKDRVRQAYQKLDPAVEDPGMGPRQIIAYRIFLEKLAQESGRTAEDVLSKAVIVVHFNDMIFESASQDLFDNDFYGFKRENVYILTDRVFRGSSLDADGLTLDVGSVTLPPGHGYALEQFNKKGHVYQIDDQGNLTATSGKTLLNVLSDRGAQVIRTQRINDLTMWTEAVGSVERLAYFLEEAKVNAATVGIELVGNPTGQKGGSFVRRKGDTQGGFLVEGLALQTPDLKQVLARAGETRAPYNAFRNYYTVNGLEDLLNKVKLPRYLRYANDRFYTEMVTGDVTQLAKKETVAFVLDQEELIHDIKNLMNIEESLGYAKKWEDMVKASSGLTVDFTENSLHLVEFVDRFIKNYPIEGAVITGVISFRIGKIYDFSGESFRNYADQTLKTGEPFSFSFYLGENQGKKITVTLTQETEAKIAVDVEWEAIQPPGSDFRVPVDEQERQYIQKFAVWVLADMKEYMEEYFPKTSSGDQNLGGIDMSSSSLDLQIKRDGNGIPLPISQQPIEAMNIQGFSFQIMGVTPVPSLFSLSGLEENADKVSLVN